MHRLSSRNPGFELLHSPISPLPTKSAVSQFCGRLKGDEGGPSDDERFVPFRQRRATDEIRPEDIGVDDDGTPLNAGAHS